VDGRVAIPKDARATGIICDSKSAGRFKGGATLSVSLTKCRRGKHQLRSANKRPHPGQQGQGKRSAALIGGGGGAGAATGAIVGAGVGAGGAGLTGNREIVVPAETPLTFKLLDPVEINSKR